MEAVRGTNFDDLFDATGFGDAGAVNVGSLGTFNDFAGAGGNDTIIGNGNTRLNYQLAAGAVTADLETSAIGTTNAITVAGSATALGEGTDSFTGVNAVQGSMFGDTLLGSSFSNTLIGLGGDDYLDGRGGFDTAGYNSLSTVTGGISVNLAAGVVTGDASVGTDTLRSIESIQGTGFADVYNAVGFGQAGALNVGNNGTFNQFEGLAGDDIITGNGNTRLIYSNATSGVTVNMAAGTVTGDASVGTDTFTGATSPIPTMRPALSASIRSRARAAMTPSPVMAARRSFSSTPRPAWWLISPLERPMATPRSAPTLSPASIMSSGRTSTTRCWAAAAMTSLMAAIVATTRWTAAAATTT